ncbi:MAG TPA: ATP synthase F1 subunit delta [Thermoguttaceae bacterium]|nr:ATP synthase F1 subunit delta [Thermoguttaceae bacterium]
MAAQIEADVGVEQVAEIYAKALLGASENAGRTTAVLEEFDAMVTEVLNGSPRFEAILTSGLIGHDEKAGMLDRVLGQQVSPLLLNFLKVVSRHGRLDCLRVIHRQMQHMYDRLQGRVEIKLTTAAPIDAQVTKAIIEKLRAVLGSEPLLKMTTDPEVIGGLVLRIGDTVYDGSVANQLKNIRKQMIDRSVHEIQSRRDRFGYPAGN